MEVTLCFVSGHAVSWLKFMPLLTPSPALERTLELTSLHPHTRRRRFSKREDDARGLVDQRS